MNKRFLGTIKYSIYFIILLVTLGGLTSCDDDNIDDNIYNDLIGQTWVGDLGFNVGRYPVESGITFRGNGYAVDRQMYFEIDGGEDAVTLELKWWVSGGNLWLDYGPNYPLLQIRNVYVSYSYLSGPLYANGSYDMDVRLNRWN